MASFLSRYQAGERIEVWTELTQMGPAVRDPGVMDDARAVARETMHRARVNIEILIPRLQELRYQFQYGSPFDPAPRGTAGNLKKLEKWMQGPVPLSLEAWWEQIGSVCFMGRHPQLNPMQGDALPDPLVFSSLEEALDTAEDWARDRKRAAKSPAPPPPIEDWRPQVEMWRNIMREQQFTDAEIEARLRPAIAAFEDSDQNRASERAAIADPRFHFDLHQTNSTKPISAAQPTMSSCPTPGWTAFWKAVRKKAPSSNTCGVLSPGVAFPGGSASLSAQSANSPS